MQTNAGGLRFELQPLLFCVIGIQFSQAVCLIFMPSDFNPSFAVIRVWAKRQVVLYVYHCSVPCPPSQPSISLFLISPP